MRIDRPTPASRRTTWRNRQAHRPGNRMCLDDGTAPTGRCDQGSTDLAMRSVNLRQNPIGAMLDSVSSVQGGR
jgi:hypothetical protein